jgi:uncharacterized membrane protein
MANDLDEMLARWVAAGAIDEAAAGRIRACEDEQSGSQGWRWPILVALIFGGVALGAGVLLFVSAHWDRLGPGARISLLVLAVAGLHAGGAFATPRFAALGATLHALGTVALGGGIFLAGQIFHLQEEWPEGVMLWAVGAWIGWYLRRDVPHLVMVALLTPAWLGSEWVSLVGTAGMGGVRILASGILLLALAYFTATVQDLEDPVRFALVWIGGVSLLPALLFLLLAHEQRTELPLWTRLIGWAFALGVPTALACILRGRAVWLNLAAMGWVLVLGELDYERMDLLVYFWCGAGSVALAAWGIREARIERINVGTIGFALTVIFFYFSNVMDKLGRSASLIGLGILFLAGGWGLEQLRRRLVAHAREAQS